MLIFVYMIRAISAVGIASGDATPEAATRHTPRRASTARLYMYIPRLLRVCMYMPTGSLDQARLLCYSRCRSA